MVRAYLMLETRKKACELTLRSWNRACDTLGMPSLRNPKNLLCDAHEDQPIVLRNIYEVRTLWTSRKVKLGYSPLDNGQQL